MKFLNPLFATQPRFTLFLLRLVLGFLFFAHGSQLVFGWFGGYGLSASISAFTEKMAIPAMLAYLAVFLNSWADSRLSSVSSLASRLWQLPST
jgi:putative oxidoreductase